MAVQRMEHVGIVVDDLGAATAFFVALGLTVQGEGEVEGAWVDRAIGLQGVRSRLVMLETPDGDARVELATFLHPPSPGGDAPAPFHARGLRHLAFAVDDLHEVLGRLQAHGAELIGEVERYKDIYLLCYLRGPEGIFVELAERLG